MNLRIEFFAKLSRSAVRPILITHVTSDFASLEEAQKIALAYADKPTIKADSIIIESVDQDQTVSERWIRDGSGWKREK